jgi:hypothetical protein
LFKKKFTLISHIFNEEFLLPYWLSWHRDIFDHGILIDYGSTDNSIDIIKEMVPHWEIIPSTYSTFEGHTCDEQVMKLERWIIDWKMALTTTEFLFGKDIREKIDLCSHKGMITRGVEVIDPITQVGKEVDPKTPLLRQRFHGLFERDSPIPIYGGHPTKYRRERVLHQAETGLYNVGRHTSRLEDLERREDLFTVRYGWSPFSEKLIERRLQTRSRTPHLGSYSHFTYLDKIGNTIFLDRKETLQRYGELSKHTKDLRLDPIFKEVWDNYFPSDDSTI